MSQNVSELLGASMAKVREMVDANTVVGTPISTGDGTTLIPISKISFAMASGGSDLKPKAAASALPFGGGAGCGVKIVPFWCCRASGCVCSRSLSLRPRRLTASSSRSRSWSTASTR